MYVKYLAVLTYSKQSMAAPGLALSLRKVTLRQGKVYVIGASRARGDVSRCPKVYFHI
jgi:hypothetical protein